MEDKFITEYVLPRPVEPLPEYARAKARKDLANRLVAAFTLSPEASSTIANAVVDPTAVRKSIGEPTAPEVEKIPVPGGGTLLGIRTMVWARKVMPDPRNPRILPIRQHPFALDPGTGGEESRFRPVPEPRTKAGATAQIAELVVDVESRDHLTWASQRASGYVLAKNNWKESIKWQGVMEAVWLVATTYEHRDDSASVTTMVSAEGSSRITAVHDLLGVRSPDVPYDENESKLRSHIKKLNEAFDRGPTAGEATAIRCEQIPALILVGFRQRQSGDTAFPTAVRSLVALRHVDPPTPWGKGIEYESLADEVLDEWFRRNLISADELDYFAGSCTRSEAREANLSDDPVIRAARIVRMFTSPDKQIREAMRTAVTSQSHRKNLSTELCNGLATALILRAIADLRKNDQTRNYMRLAFVQSVVSDKWQCTDRDTESLATAALREVRQSIRAESHSDPGPASLELVVRAMYPLIVSGKLKATLGSRGNDPTDRKLPAPVLDVMRRTLQGVYQLRQALRDFATGQQIRAVDDSGQIKKDGSKDKEVDDEYLRSEFSAGKARSPRPGDTPTDNYHNRIDNFVEAVESLNQSFAAIRDVTSDDGQLLVDTRGIDPRVCVGWREDLRRIDEELIVWGINFKRVFGTTVEGSSPEFDDDDEDSPTESAVGFDASDELSESPSQDQDKFTFA
jgi:hypothetical protein